MINHPVVIAGAGIGDIDQLSLGVLRELQEADCIVYDRLLDAELLDLAPGAEKISAGKSKDRHTLKQNAINALLVEKYRAGKKVLRLKGGDPFVFGRGGEEAEYLRAHGVPFTTYPGITSGVAVPAMAGIPVTFRDMSRAVTFVTAYTKDGPADFSPYAALPSTLVIYMGLSRAKDIAADLIEGGKDSRTPVAVISKGGDPDMETCVATLEEVSLQGIPENLASPALIVVGEVVGRRDILDPAFNNPVSGRTIVLTGDRGQDALAQKLRHMGFHILRRPMIDIRPINRDVLERDCKRFEANTLVFTSKNAVRFFFDAFLHVRDIRTLDGVDVYALGEKTDEALARYGIRSEGHPDIYDKEHLIDYLKKESSEKQRTFYYPHSKLSDPVLGDALHSMGRLRDIAIYDTTCPATARPMPARCDAIVFTSSSAVKNFSSHYGFESFADATFFAIGPSTKRTLVKFGVKEDNISLGEKATMDALYHKIVKEFSRL
ncbi:MAG: uroporphyrinogen-III C-methyltransferase [Peptoniphilus sp.]|nr:uroporphyrinogen-III C-methyltransferase [Peptoniphilus sp.]MDD7363102.1 uroporphyrinogen-III C-methyltransferase [Bacillota bacterium]MDY6044376.1 uroporphyrinogen-III C-methyltransferase [Peptoniphilus sp.]